jgi:putative endonuclease
MRDFHVYIVASRSRVLYTGVTGDLKRRIWQHREKQIPGFSAKYNTVHLVWYQATPNSHSAIAREKQIKGWVRAKKIGLIESVNPKWRDLAEEWFER